MQRSRRRRNPRRPRARVADGGRESRGVRRGRFAVLARAARRGDLGHRDARRAQAPAEVEDDQPGSGALLALVTRPEDPQGPHVEVPLPLQHTDVHAVITGYVGSVDVTQQFANPYDEKIEAVYMFPLPEKAAVSEFVMTIGERKIRGILREKEEAQRIYEDARAQGYRASLLVQHRPNVFEQKVANIEPGKRIDVNIRYFHTLAYEDGWYSFVFPTVVGPRYNPAGFRDPIAAVPRADNREPVSGAAVRYLRPSERSAHDIGIAVDVDAGVAIEELAASHAIKTSMDGRNRAHVELASASTMPNRDFVLRFRVAGDEIKSSFLTYTDPKSQQGYFTLMIYPPAGLVGTCPPAARDGVRDRHVGLDVGPAARAGGGRGVCRARSARQRRHFSDHELLDVRERARGRTAPRHARESRSRAALPRVARRRRRHRNARRNPRGAQLRAPIRSATASSRS